jgi:hypothetical protein
VTAPVRCIADMEEERPQDDKSGFMQLGVVLIVAGILMGLSTALYRHSRPRKQANLSGPCGQCC